MMLTYTLFHKRNGEKTFSLGHGSPQLVLSPMEEPEFNICMESHFQCYVSTVFLLFKVPKGTGWN